MISIFPVAVALLAAATGKILMARAIAIKQITKELRRYVVILLLIESGIVSTIMSWRIYHDLFVAPSVILPQIDLRFPFLLLLKGRFPVFFFPFNQLSACCRHFPDINGIISGVKIYYSSDRAT